MNVNILLKCLRELEQAEPKLDYLRGMIETLIEMSHPTIEQAAKAAGMDKLLPALARPADEGSALDSTAAAKLSEVKKMAGESLHE